MLFAMCAYCKGYGHYKSHCLKLITKNASKSLCRDFNRFKKSSCEADNHSCTHGREHRCSICHSLDCKAYLHVQQQTFFESKGHDMVVKELILLIKEMASQLDNLRKDCDDMKTKITDFTNDEEIISSSTPVTTPSSFLPKDNTFLALPVTSANKDLSMPISTGFPLSAVSENHARKVLKASRANTSSQLDLSPSSNSLSTANGQTLPINKPIVVPLTFATGRTMRFEMIVIEALSHDIVFGQNHLERLDATIYFSSGKILFRHPDFNVTLSCSFVHPPDNTVLAMTSVVK